MIKWLRSLWESDRNPYAWDLRVSVSGNTGHKTHGYHYVHKYWKQGNLRKFKFVSRYGYPTVITIKPTCYQ